MSVSIVRGREEDMRNVKGSILAAVTLLALSVGPAWAGHDGLVLRGLGWYQGESTVSSDGIRCEVPTTTSAIGDSLFAMGLWNTFGIETLHFPDTTNPFGNPCGGWFQVSNAMRTQGITLNKIKFRYKIANRKRLRGVVPMRNGFPANCRSFRKQVSFTGARLGPNSFAAPFASGSGASNVAFVQVVPMISASTITCLQDELAPLTAGQTDPTTDSFSDFSVIIKSRAFGRADNGNTYKSNMIRYTLTLRSVCGNGRVDNFEQCDPSSSGQQCSGSCNAGTGFCTRNPARLCATDADCQGTCQAPGGREECLCLF